MLYCSHHYLGMVNANAFELVGYQMHLNAFHFDVTCGRCYMTAHFEVLIFSQTAWFMGSLATLVEQTLNEPQKPNCSNGESGIQPSLYFHGCSNVTVNFGKNVDF